MNEFPVTIANWIISLSLEGMIGNNLIHRTTVVAMKAFEPQRLNLTVNTAIVLNE